jgi:serine/threonine protein kinase
VRRSSTSRRPASVASLLLFATLFVHAPSSALAESIQVRVKTQGGKTPGVERTLELGQVLGAGGYGTTYRAHDVAKPSDEFAVKVLRGNHPNVIRILEQESQLLERLETRSNAFLKSHGIGEVIQGQAPTKAFAMELLTGKSLGGAGPGAGWDAPLHLAPGKAVRVARTLLGQLKELHAQGYVHGDVHTANTRIDDGLHSWTAKLIDFGTAHGYTPAGGRDDVANIGRILLENLTGRVYWDAVALPLAARYRASVNGRTVTLADVISRAMQGGYASAQDLHDALDPFAPLAP